MDIALDDPHAFDQPTPDRIRRVEPGRNILAVDDDRVALMMLEDELSGLGYEVETASTGEAALNILRERPTDFDVIVLDKIMPGISGLDVVRELKADFDLRNIPVVMVTGDDNPEEIREGVDAGVFHYLTKPVDNALLRSVVNSALRDANQKRLVEAEMESRLYGFNLIEACKFSFRTLEEAYDLASFVAQCFPDPGRVAPGLTELLVNAVEHGNLEIGFELKAKLIREGGWREEIERRLNDPDYADRIVEAAFKRREDGYAIVVTDQGKGFAWKSFLLIDPSRASASTGRGIAQAATASFDKLVYNEAGNQAVGFVKAVGELDW